MRVSRKPSMYLIKMCIEPQSLHKTYIAQVLEYRVRVRRGEDSSWSSSRLVRTESTDTVFSGERNILLIYRGEIFG